MPEFRLQSRRAGTLAALTARLQPLPSVLALPVLSHYDGHAAQAEARTPTDPRFDFSRPIRRVVFPAPLFDCVGSFCVFAALRESRVQTNRLPGHRRTGLTQRRKAKDEFALMGVPVWRRDRQPARSAGTLSRRTEMTAMIGCPSHSASVSCPPILRVRCPDSNDFLNFPFDIPHAHDYYKTKSKEPNLKRSLLKIKTLSHTDARPWPGPKPVN